MKLFDFISVISADEVVQVRNDEHTLYFGNVRNVYDAFSTNEMKSLNVTYVFTGFSGLIIDVSGS